MGQERKYHSHNTNEFQHEIEQTQKFLDNLRNKQIIMEKESNLREEQDKHEIVQYDEHGKPITKGKSLTKKLFTPRFAFISKRCSKYHRIFMAIVCTLITLSFVVSSGFNLGYLKYLNVLTQLLVNIYFIVSVIFCLDYTNKRFLIEKSSAKPKILRVLMCLFGTCFSLAIFVVVCKLEYTTGFFEKNVDEKFKVIFCYIHKIIALYMLLMIICEYIEIYYRDIWMIVMFQICYLLFMCIYIIKYKMSIYGIDTNNFPEKLVYIIMGSVFLTLGYLVCAFVSKILFIENGVMS